MSTRQLRRLRRQQEEFDQTHQPQASEDDVELCSQDDQTPVKPNSKPRASIFAALGDLEAGQDEGANESLESTGPDDFHPPPPSKGNRRKKNKSKAKKQNSDTSRPLKAKEKDQTDEGEGWELKHDGDDINRSTVALPTQPSTEPTDGMKGLLLVNPAHLRPGKEMRSHFGRDVTEVAEAEVNDAPAAGDRRRRRHIVAQRRGPPTSKKMPSIILDSNIFVQGRDHWPYAGTGGLSSCSVKSSADSVEYTFLHSPDYLDVEAAFVKGVLSGDPRAIEVLVLKNPYHVSSLLQASLIVKQRDQDDALAAELCERALFAFGRIVTSDFRKDIKAGRARLNFQIPENRQLWLAGYRYLRALCRKGTYRTALEWAKLLYSLNRSDPYALLHFVPPLAIRAHQYGWLLNFLTAMPSAAAAIPGSDYSLQTRVLAHLHLDDSAAAADTLRHGLIQLPWLYAALFGRLNLSPPPLIWGAQSPSATASFWTALYLHLSGALWKNARATQLLRDVAGIAQKATTTPETVEVDVPLSVVRLAYLEDKALFDQALFVTEVMYDGEPIFDFDPLPPPEQEQRLSAQISLPLGNNVMNLGALEIGEEIAWHLQATAGTSDAEIPQPGNLNDPDDDDERDEHDVEDENSTASPSQMFINLLSGFFRNAPGEREGRLPPGSWPNNPSEE